MDHVSNGSNEAGAWMAWFGKIGESLVDFGDQVGETSTLGETGESTRLAGFSLISAASFEAALAIARGCPALEAGGGVEIGSLLELAATGMPGSDGATPLGGQK
jgi:hypothetical protein